ncbi:MAG: META domain-containing protein [Aestuariibacter sp.]|nr:META domain-containing protein [Aestuariibacter sp.]
MSNIKPLFYSAFLLSCTLTALAAWAQSTSNNPVAVNTSLNDLQHHRWVLRDIDGMDLQAYAVNLGFDQDDRLRKIPELDFGEQGHVEGNTGCNQIQGQARVEGNQLIMSSLASTRMFCAGFAGELELKLSMLYTDPLAISREGEMLILQSSDTTLRFQLKDWVQ